MYVCIYAHNNPYLYKHSPTQHLYIQKEICMYVKRVNKILILILILNPVKKKSKRSGRLNKCKVIMTFGCYESKKVKRERSVIEESPIFI